MGSGETDPRARFSSRVEDYLRYRPRYPPGLVEVLRDETGLEPGWTVADVGSGTGMSAEPFLDHGNAVLAVEPNAEMREAAEALLGGRAGFRSLSGTAEDTGLERESVDLVLAGQAFHWFHRERARVEFMRILRPPRWTALVWNTRVVSAGPFAEGYEALLERFGTDCHSVRHDRLGRQELAAFFGGPFKGRSLHHSQRFDRAGLEGRLRSTSYTPAPGEPGHQPMMEALRDLFEAHAEEGRVEMPYETEVFVGALAE